MFEPFTILLCAALTPQTIGGDQVLQYSWRDPNSSADRFGSAITSFGDLDGDGGHEILVKGEVQLHLFSSATSAPLLSLDPNDYGTGSCSWGRFADVGDTNGDGHREILATFKHYNANSDRERLYLLISSQDGSELARYVAGLDDDEGVPSFTGDINGDGFMDFAVGIPNKDSFGVIESGTVLVRSGIDGQILYQWTGVTTEAHYGNSIASAGDADADGTPDLAIRYQELGVGSRVEIRSGATGSLIREFQDNDDGGFGAMECAGDVDLDGNDDLWISSPGPYLQPTVLDKVILYSGKDGSEIRRLFSSGGDGSFGRNLANIGDTNNDGIDDIVISSPEDEDKSDAVYVFSGSDGELIYRALMPSYSGVYGSNGALAAAGDLNGDGRPDFAVGRGKGRGEVLGVSFHPLAEISANEISASAGGILNFELDFPETSAGHGYRILASALAPRPTKFGIVVPLARDNMAINSYQGIYPFANHQNLQGNLDIDGNATASIDLTAGLSSTLVGTSLHFAAISIPSGIQPNYSSVALSVVVVP